MNITIDTGSEMLVFNAVGIELKGKELIVDDGNTNHVINPFVSFKAGSLDVPQFNVSK